MKNVRQMSKASRKTSALLTAGSMRKLCVCALVVGVFCLYGADPAFPQRDQADRDVRGEVSEKMEAPPPPRPKAEVKADVVVPVGPQLYVSDIKLVGTESFAPEVFDPIIAKYEGREVTRVELDVLARAIQRDYLNRGVIAACFIPPQDVKEGVITLQVLEAKMGELQIKDHPFYDKARLASYWSIRPNEVLRYDEMSRNLQLMNSNPDRELRATLTAGKKPQTTDVILDVATQFPVHVTASVDNEGGADTGKIRKTIGIRDNNALFADDILMGGYSYGTSFSNIYAYHRVPITNFGTNVMYGFSYSKSSPKKDQTPLGLTTLSENVSIFVYQDFFHKNEYLGDFHIGIDAKDKTVKVTSGVINRDRLRILRFGSKLRGVMLGGMVNLSPEISQGLNAFGARRKNVFSSRRPGVDDGIENTFTIFKMDASYNRRLPLGMQTSMRFKCQVSSEKLPSQEEFSIGGINSVRGYPSGDYSADDAFQTNIEVMFPAFFIPGNLKIPYGENAIKNEVTGMVFFDYAHGERKGVLDSVIRSTGEKRIVDFSSIGAGLRIRLFNQALLRVEWGYPIGGNSAISETAPSRLHISLDFEDKLPREIARLQKEIEEQEIKSQAWDLLNGEITRRGSLLGATLNRYQRLAEIAKVQGDFKTAKDYYERIFSTGRSLYMQSESYVRECIEREKELKSYSRLIKQYFYDGNLTEAMRLSRKMLDEAKLKPLELVF